MCDGCRVGESTVKPGLTFRESQVIDLVSQGKTNKAIAGMLYLSTGSIKQYLNRIFQKTDTENRTELAAKWIKGGI